MKGLKQFGAMALAAALAVTFISPMAVKAHDDDTHYSSQEHTYYDTDINGEWQTSKTGRKTFVPKSETYKNKVTGDTFTEDYDTGNETGNYWAATRDYFGNPTKLNVGVKGLYKFTLSAEAGESFDGKVKIKSGKANVSVKQLGKHEWEEIPTYDGQAKQYYFDKLDGSREYVGAELTEEQRYAMKRTYVEYTYALYGKKVGQAKLQYTINGSKKKIKVKVVEDARPFKSVTYRGKSLQLDYNEGATNSNYYAKQSTNKAGNFYTTKKSGKFKVAMNKDFKFIAMYVLTDNDYETKTDNDPEGYYKSSSIERKSTGGIDLNGDGDYADTIDGIREASYSDQSYTKYTNKSAKINLSTSFDRVDSSWESWDSTKKSSYKGTHKYDGNIADTTILVVYQNKITKAFGTKTFTINYAKISKK